MAKYLIVGPSWVGDMVMAQSLFITIKQQEPDAIIDVIGPNWSVPILARMPEIRNAIVLPTNHGEWGIKTRFKIGKDLRSENYNKAIVIPRSWKSALIPFFAQIPHRVGFKGEQRYVLLNERRKLDKTILNQTVKRFVSLGTKSDEAYPPRTLPQPKLIVDKANQAEQFKTHGLSNRPAVALMPGAEFGPSKQWPISHFRELAKKLIEKGYQVWVLGGPKDQDDGDKITQELGEYSINLCGKTQLIDAIDLLNAAEVAVSNDSGLMHVAAAVGIKVHGIYGSTSELFTPPLTNNKVIHNLNLDCSPCFKRSCPLEHTNCLKLIKPSQISRDI
ncbi:lipopolysaccharide heptosyltransferase II [Marinomonas posidonica]|uniref:lipopolysaccharide heptosyltransferase II n=1 Tax=Marinomonas posidonica (strain CECT 7376 / NCIMB 14433 / IVIA-Po-181) TaxID=491952 RepID=F6CS43_MARPP|nr:lipopolysaccharide heptosyltransferase II [Marinomonas posidonica]AEF53830.1 lipopolysaccharide heptosyltransferase II [Marinomonas posidonica IVIA-Po-181]